jgi:hypothetical protein
MKIRILPLKVAESIESEENLADLSVLESIYEIRALKAAIELSDKEIEITEVNDLGQVYIDSHEIWLRPDTFIEL